MEQDLVLNSKDSVICGLADCKVVFWWAMPVNYFQPIDSIEIDKFLRWGLQDSYLIFRFFGLWVLKIHSDFNANDSAFKNL